MTNWSTATCVALFLLPLAGCTSAQKPQTPEPMAALTSCSLTPCVLPGRPAPGLNSDWGKAVDRLEDELKACAAQVLGCIMKQQGGEEVAPSAGTFVSPIQRNSAAGDDPDSGYAPLKNQ